MSQLLTLASCRFRCVTTDNLGRSCAGAALTTLLLDLTPRPRRRTSDDRGTSAGPSRSSRRRPAASIVTASLGVRECSGSCPAKAAAIQRPENHSAGDEISPRSNLIPASRPGHHDAFPLREAVLCEVATPPIILRALHTDCRPQRPSQCGERADISLWHTHHLHPQNGPTASAQVRGGDAVASALDFDDPTALFHPSPPRPPQRPARPERATGGGADAHPTTTTTSQRRSNALWRFRRGRYSRNYNFSYASRFARTRSLYESPQERRVALQP